MSPAMPTAATVFPPVAPLTLCAMALVALLAAEKRASALGKWLTKPLASAGFMWIALGRWEAGQLTRPALLLALGLCMVGDVLLIPKRRAAFLAGLISFLSGHAVYAAIFIDRGIDVQALALTAAPVLLICGAVLRWLWPVLRETNPRMRLPVTLYVVVIGAMVCAAGGTEGAAGSDGILVGATLFFVSDLFVARNRFVSPGFVNRLIGLPLYYAAQCLLAWTV